MLEEFSKKLIFDAHFHYSECSKMGICEFPDGWSGISCAHSVEEWEIQKNAPESVIKAFGIHPQIAGFVDIQEYADFLEKLLLSGDVSAVGEAGFDHFTEEFKKSKQLQEKAWEIQLELAKKYNKLLIVHCRKANEKLFEYSKELSKLPEVLFHSFMGTPIEAKSLLNRGINAYFSFGKQIFNNNKKVLACVRELPAERVIAETDAPYQFLKGESFTAPNEILKIIEEMNRLKKN